MKNILQTTIFVLFFFNSFAQIKTEEIKKAYPIIGWDSLKTIVEEESNYPTILRAAGVSGNIFVSLSIDSTGTLVGIEPAPSYISKQDSLTYKYLIPVVENILAPIKWFPSYRNNVPINDKIYWTFNFVLLYTKEKAFNIIAPYFYFHTDY